MRWSELRARVPAWPGVLHDPEWIEELADLVGATPPGPVADHLTARDDRVYLLTVTRPFATPEFYLHTLEQGAADRIAPARPRHGAHPLVQELFPTEMMEELL